VKFLFFKSRTSFRTVSLGEQSQIEKRAKITKMFAQKMSKLPSNILTKEVYLESALIACSLLNLASGISDTVHQGFF
jgi:hypothetical protein